MIDDSAPLEVTPDGTGVNWDVRRQQCRRPGQVIGELQAQIPRVGPSGPQWDPTRRPVHDRFRRVANCNGRPMRRVPR